MTRRNPAVLAVVVVVLVAVVSACSQGDATSAERSVAPTTPPLDIGPGVDLTGSEFIDPSIQESLQRALATHMPDTGGRFVAAGIVVDVASAEIVAYAATSAVAADLLDHQRPSGSTLKLLVDVAAAELGAGADDGVVGGRNCVFPDGVAAETTDHAPVMSIRLATAGSVNCAFGKLARAVGPERLAAVVAQLGITRTLDPSTAFGFGANTISMRELATAAVNLVDGGRGAHPGLGASDRVAGAGAPTLRETTLPVVIDMTSGVLGGGTAAGLALDDRWAIAKTGTAARSTDAWIVGVTERYAAVVWVGNPRDGDDSMASGGVPGHPTVHGGSIPGLVWHDVMTDAHTGIGPAPPPVASVTRDPVVVVDPTTDCAADRSAVRTGEPGPDLPWIATGGEVVC